MLDTLKTAQDDLLADEIFTVDAGAGDRVSLPSLLARLISGEPVHSFPGVAAPQRSHWWRFLVRCGAKSFRELGLTVDEVANRSATQVEKEMGDVLRSLVPNGGWCLSQPDATKPGFLQAPTPDGEPPETSYKVATVAILTAALGQKDHDRKYEKGRRRTPEQTVYALLAYQGGAVFGGRTYYKTPLSPSRSGQGSGVPFMWGRQGGDLQASYLADLGGLLDAWDEIRDQRGLRGGIWALWGERWDGETGLQASKLDPAFIPLARLVRLGPPEGGRYSTLYLRGSQTDRIDDHTQGGHLGDPFTPLVVDPRRGHLKVRGTLRGGYGYREVVKLLFGEGATASPSVTSWMKRGSGDSNLRVVFEGLAFEQGKTCGYHRREVLLPPEVRPFLDDPIPLYEVDEQSMRIVAETKNAIRAAIRLLVHGAPQRKKGDDGVVDRSTKQFDRLVDQQYLPHLIQSSVAHGRGEAEWVDEWAESVGDMARTAFLESVSATPCSTNTKLERRVRAEAYLGARLRKIRGANGE